MSMTACLNCMVIWKGFLDARMEINLDCWDVVVLKNDKGFAMVVMIMIEALTTLGWHVQYVLYLTIHTLFLCIV